MTIGTAIVASTKVRSTGDIVSIQSSNARLSAVRGKGAQPDHESELVRLLWGIAPTHAINVEMPILVFAFLFGISMDYQVFIISRMREAYDRTRSMKAAVVEGIGRTRPPRHQRRAYPRPLLRRLQRNPQRRGQDVRDRARRRHPDRRHDHPRPARAGLRRDPRPLELVAAQPRRTRTARPGITRPAQPHSQRTAPDGVTES